MDETFAQGLRRIRCAHGLTQEQLGARAGYSPKYVSDLELGRRQPHPDLARRFDRTLHADGTLAELAARGTHEPVDGPWTEHAAQDVLAQVAETALTDRRDFLTLSAGATAGLALAWSTAPPARPTDVVTPTVVEHLTARVEQLWHLDDLIGGGNCLDAGASDLRLVEQLIRHGRYGKRVGAQMYSLAASIARFCGWAAFDAGYGASAQRYWHAALRTAAAAGDVDQGVYVLSNLALQAAYAGDGAVAVQILDVARRRVDPAARTVLAMLDCWAVRGHAIAGDHRTAAALLNRADDLWERRRAGDDPGWVYWMPRPSLTAEAGTALMEIGDLGAAERSLTAGLATLGEDSARERVLYLVRLAEVRLRSGRLDEAVRTASEMADAAAGVSSARTQARMDHLLEQLPVGEPAVAELRERIRDAAGPDPE